MSSNLSCWLAVEQDGGACFRRSQRHPTSYGWIYLIYAAVVFLPVSAQDLQLLLCANELGFMKPWSPIKYIFSLKSILKVTKYYHSSVTDFRMCFKDDNRTEYAQTTSF